MSAREVDSQTSGRTSFKLGSLPAQDPSKDERLVRRFGGISDAEALPVPSDPTPWPLPTLTSSLEGGDTAAYGRPAPQTRSLRSVASGVALVFQVPSPDNYCTGCAGGGGILEAVCVARLAQACL